MAAGNRFVSLGRALFLAVLFAMEMANGAAVPAIFIFGDSTVDVGNNNFLPNTTAKADFLHNGIDFPGAVPTGRFSNGYNSADFLADLMGFTSSPPPFLSLAKAALPQQMFSGINFASGGSGIRNSTGNSIGGAIPLSVQIESFKMVRENMTVLMGSAAIDLLSNSLFIISVGSNDFFEYYSEYGSQNDTLNDLFITELISMYKDYLSILYQLGAKKFGIIGVPPIGCCPHQRIQNQDGDCLQDLNELTQKFCQATDAFLNELSFELEGMKYSLGNTYNMVINIFNYPNDYGIKELSAACCGGGPLNGGMPCTPNATFCSNREDYLFWDQYHPTQKVSNLTAQALYNGSTTYVTPINFRQLAEDE